MFTRMAKQREVEAKFVEEEEEAPIYGDILEKVLSHVPLIDLVSASQASHAWNAAVSSSLRHVNIVKPWLIVHAQKTRPPYSTTAHAYDPRSGDWFKINQKPPIRHVSAIRSSHSTLLYVLSATKLAFSSDALRLTWHVTDAPPFVWRTDPIVALVGGDRLVVAGGPCDFSDDPLTVEIYDLGARAWSACSAMPELLRDSAASTLLSIAVRGGEMFVADKCSGLAFAFDPAATTWRGPFDLRRGDESVFSSVIEFSGNGDMIAVGLSGSPESVKTVIMRKFSGESFEEFEALGEMPKEMVERLKGESSCVSSISVAAKGSFVFIHNPADPREVIQCEMVHGGCRWASVRNAAVDDGVRITHRLVVGCADVSFDDLRRDIATDSVSFSAVVAK